MATPDLSAVKVRCLSVAATGQPPTQRFVVTFDWWVDGNETGEMFRLPFGSADQANTWTPGTLYTLTATPVA